MAEPVHALTLIATRHRNLKAHHPKREMHEFGRFGVTGDAKSGQLPRAGALP